jgi:hypothetical protein
MFGHLISGDITYEMTLRYVVAITFLLSGLLTIAKRKLFGSASAFVGKLNVSGELKCRLDAACRQRERDEAFPSSTLGAGFGALQIAIAMLIAATNISLEILFACMYCPLAVVTAVLYLRLRAAGAKRYASLDVRDLIAVAPSYIWAVAVIATVTPLLWLPVDPTGALLATISGIAISILGNRVATMPALLHGDDLVVERFLDDRLREGRTSSILALGIMPGLSLHVLSETQFSNVASHIGWDVEMLAFIVIVGRVAWLMRRAPSDTERSQWSRAAT